MSIPTKRESTTKKTWLPKRPIDPKLIFIILSIFGIVVGILISVLCLKMWLQPRNLPESSTIIAKICRPDVRKLQVMNNTCENPACNRIADEILADMDEKVKPCDNFYRFVCGGFMKNAKVSPGWPSISRLEMIQNKAVEKFHQLMMKKNPADLEAYKQVKSLYKACMNTPAIEKNGLKTLEKYINEFGGWPAVVGDEWKEENFSWTNLTFDLRKSGFPFDTFIKFHIETHQLFGNDARMLTVSPVEHIFNYSRLNGLNNSIVYAYHERMVKIAKAMGAAVPEVELWQVLELDKKLFKIFSTENISRVEESNILTVNATMKQHPTIPWMDFWSKIINWDVSEAYNEYVYTWRPSFLDDYMELIKNTPRRVQANYIIWRSVVETSVELIDFEKKVGIFDRRSRKEKCFDIIPDKLKLAVDALHIKNFLTPRNKANINNLMTNIQNQLRIKFGELKTSDNQSEIVKNIQEFSVYLTYARNFYDDEKIEKYYKDLKIDNENFLQSILNANINNFNRKYEEINSKYKKWHWTVYYSPGRNLTFNNILKNFEVPTSFLQSSLYDQDVPDYMNYGGLGTQLALILSQAMLDDKMVPLTAYKAVNYPSNCQHCDKYRIKDEKKFLALILGLDAVHGAFQDFLLETSINEKLLKLSYDPVEAFWISSVHSQCVKFENSGSEDLSESEKNLFLYFMNSRVFLKDFNCVDRLKPDNCP